MHNTGELFSFICQHHSEWKLGAHHHWLHRTPVGHMAQLARASQSAAGLAIYNLRYVSTSLPLSFLPNA